MQNLELILLGDWPFDVRVYPHSRTVSNPGGQMPIGEVASRKHQELVGASLAKFLHANLTWQSLAYEIREICKQDAFKDFHPTFSARE